jgi:hypothetical protein
MFRGEEWTAREKKAKDTGMDKQEQGLRAIQWKKAALKRTATFKWQI